MNRLTVVQGLLSRRPDATYLEIGVFNGHVLFRVKARRKIAVDPHFAFGPLRRFGKAFSNRSNWKIEYHEKDSDRFFEKDADRVFGGRTLNVALIDGLHDHETALRDVESCLKYLKDDGVLVLHDCNPISETAARSLTSMGGVAPATGTWNGDVWKTIVRLRSTRRDLDVFVANCDHGLGIVTRGKAEGPLELSEAEIQSFGYDDLARNRSRWLNLKPAEYLRTRFRI